jgi:mercuric ion transport protein
MGDGRCRCLDLCIFRKSVDQRASRHFASIAAPHGVSKRALARRSAIFALHFCKRCRARIPTYGASRAVGTRSVLLTLGGLTAAFGVASCCGLPFLLATAGIGTTWLTGFALLAAPHWSILLIVGAVCLAGGAVLFWRQQRIAACTPGAFCSRPDKLLSTLWECRLALRVVDAAGRRKNAQPVATATRRGGL